MEELVLRNQIGNIGCCVERIQDTLRDESLSDFHKGCRVSEEVQWIQRCNEILKEELERKD